MSWVDVTTAIGTAGAAIVALGLGASGEWRARRVERRQAEFEERRQAAHVAAWIIIEQDDGQGPTEVISEETFAIGANEADFFVVLQNASDEPIWDARIYFRYVIKNESKVAWLEKSVKIVGPNDKVKLPIKELVAEYGRTPIELAFIDNAGREWKRDTNGRLNRLPGPYS
jgi:hypothetical protein